ncbi:MAG: sensor histidine kinase [Intrasporangium sp.]|uniref:sensor histidine kinase n=1 Tax=Intrasporangium sp. TaxID=1925024 RepID=UPI0026496121|nr:sensor histidine kinase [Intrasporangium sp.]MDN5797870.1 sensor histidine kinase [Intrasporangium sp.]
MAQAQDGRVLAAAEQRWRRRETTFFRWLPHGLLLIITTVVLLGALSRITPVVLLGLVLATSLWEACWSTARVRRSTRGSPGLGRAGRLGWAADLTYLAGLFVLTAGLDLAHPLYGFFTWFLFIRTFDVARGWPRWVGVVVIAGLISWTQSGSPVQLTSGLLVFWAALLVMNAGIAVAVVRFMEASERHGQRRQELLAELEASNERLQQVLAENASLYDQLLAQAHEAGVQAERERFAGEVHDTIAQGLAGVITQLEALERAGSPQERHRHAGQAKQIARDSLAEARRFLAAVGPERLEQARLPDAVRELAASWAAQSGVAARVEVVGTVGAVAADAEVALYRAAQEALTNVAKHACASRAVVTLSYTDTAILLDVRDDGCGCDATAPAHGTGFGLRSMRRRVAALGGQVTLESEPGAGATLSAVIPTRVPMPAAPSGLRSGLEEPA